jgi:hypothetical protein
VAHRLCDQWVLLRTVVSVSREQPNAGSIPPRRHPVPVVLDLVHPLWPAGRALGGHWQGRLDEGKTRYDEHSATFRRVRCGESSRQRKAPPKAGPTFAYNVMPLAAASASAASAASAASTTSAAAAAPSAASAPSAAASAASAATAALGLLFAEPACSGVLLVEDKERPQADVGDFLLA